MAIPTRPTLGRRPVRLVCAGFRVFVQPDSMICCLMKLEMDMRSIVIRWISRLGTLALFLAGVEAMARLDDYIHLGVPFLASPDNEHDLKLRESWGFRGRPHGLFRKWQLNEFGFRGPETTRQPADGATRILVLGASETFGLMESNSHEYPVQLQKVLQQEGNYEVINGGMTSLTAASMSAYWDQWLVRFQPQIVAIYASPVFYLRDVGRNRSPS